MQTQCTSGTLTYKIFRCIRMTIGTYWTTMRKPKQTVSISTSIVTASLPRAVFSLLSRSIIGPATQRLAIQLYKLRQTYLERVSTPTVQPLHSHDRAIYAFTLDMAIGVDI